MATVEGQKAIEHLKEKWTSGSCPMCGSDNWNVQDSIFQLTEYSQGSMVLGGPVIPVIPVICGNCGNTVLVNAIIAGVINLESGGKP